MSDIFNKYPYKSQYEIDKNRARQLLFKYYVAKNKGKVTKELHKVAKQIQYKYGIILEIAS